MHPSKRSASNTYAEPTRFWSSFDTLDWIAAVFAVVTPLFIAYLLLAN